MLVPFIIGIIALLIVFKIYLKACHRTFTLKTKMTGKTVIITGSNTGIGYATAVDLAKRGARVILACRRRKTGKMAVNKILSLTPKAQVINKALNLESFHSVLLFAQDILKNEQRLDVLINNAGTGVLDNSLTKDGLPIEAQVNHFSPFLLTMLLLPLLRASVPSRIINVSSAMHRFGTIEKFDKQATYFLKRRRVYSNTKLANILFTRRLRKFLRCTGVTVNCLHPGAVNTDMFRHQPGIIKYLLSFLFLTPEEGAQTSIYLAVAKGLSKTTGKYFTNCTVARPAKGALDDTAAEKLWKMSIEVIVKYWSYVHVTTKH